MVTMRSLLVESLVVCRFKVMLIHRSLFLRSGPGRNAVITAIETYMIIDDSISFDHRPVNISIMNIGSVDVYYGRIVAEMVAIPTSAGKAYTKEATSVIYTAIKAYMPAPITRMIAIIATIITPVTWGPQITRTWWCHPYTGYPIIIAFIWIPGPIAGLP